MSKARRELQAARAQRDEARARFDAQLLHLRGDPEAESVGERLIGRLGQDARRSMDIALDVAAESKGIAAATAAALALWLLRGPILAWIDELWNAGGAPDDETDAPQEVPPDA